MRTNILRPDLARICEVEEIEMEEDDSGRVLRYRVDGKIVARITRFQLIAARSPGEAFQLEIDTLRKALGISIETSAPGSRVITYED